MEGISSFRNEIEIPFIFNVNQRTTDNGLWVCIFSRSDAEERKVHYSFLRRVNVCFFYGYIDASLLLFIQ
jgi:hypothetical protein